MRVTEKWDCRSFHGWPNASSTKHWPEREQMGSHVNIGKSHSKLLVRSSCCRGRCEESAQDFQPRRSGCRHLLLSSSLLLWTHLLLPAAFACRRDGTGVLHGTRVLCFATTTPTLHGKNYSCHYSHAIPFCLILTAISFHLIQSTDPLPDTSHRRNPWTEIFSGKWPQSETHKKTQFLAARGCY